MAEANPTLVGTKIGDGDATEMGANGGAHENLGVLGVGEGGHRSFVEQGRIWERASLLHLCLCQSSNENELSVPGGLENLTGRKLRDVELLVGVTDISSSRDHLLIECGDNGLDTEHVRTEDEALQHVDLSSLDFIVLVLLVPDSIMLGGVI